MALTYPLNQIDNRLIFKRERSYLTTIVYVFGGLIFAFGSLAIPFIVLKIMAFLGGITFCIAAIYLPSLKNRFSPEQVVFERISHAVTLEMNSGYAFKMSLHNVKEFIIETEKRSPSAANSVGVHYLHHHINMKRENDAIWTVTSTTDAEEAKQVQVLLNRVLEPSDVSDFYTHTRPPSSIQIEVGKSIIIQWQDGNYKLSIETDTIQYTENKSNKGNEIMRQFKLSAFKCVRYSYSATIKNKNWTIVIVFEGEQQTQLNLFFRDLNPVECLQFERWLEQTIQKKLSA